MRIPRQDIIPSFPPLGLGTLPSLSFSSRQLFVSVWVPLLLSLMTTVPIQLRLWRRADQMLDRNVIANGTEFDFIIVGAGLAGGVVANRLSKTGHSVLLLEAGGEPYPLQIIPGLLMMFINNPETDWMFRSVPQKKASLNSVNQESSWSVGKGLGGTGTLNIMIYLRGHEKDFNNWAKLTNDSSWSFEGMKEHFNSIEEYVGDQRSPYHGHSGELRVAEPDYLGIADAFVEAAGEFGYPKVDLNAPYKEGFDRIKYPTSSDGRRIASYQAFIQPVRSRKNLSVLKYAEVTKVLLDDSNRAYGVEYSKFGETYTVHAKKEVILSAGTVGTAKILLLSGIGPKSHLEEVSIPVKADLPVGVGLQDHLGVYLHPFFISEPGKTIRIERDFTPGSITDWIQNGKGVLSSSGVQASGCISSSFAKERGEGDWPDIHYFLFGFSATQKITKLVSKAFNLVEEEIRKYHEHADKDNRDSFYIIVTGSRPFSRGFVKLKSNNPKDAPIIDPKYLEDEGDTDLKVLVEAVKRSVEMMENSTAIGQKMGGQFTSEKLPGCENHPHRTDEYWQCYVQRYSVTLHHPVGTARMGREDDPNAVVDTRLRVRGVSGLRVADSSIQPEIIVTNTGASAMTIGAKASTMIIEDWIREKEIQKDDLDASREDIPLDNRLKRSHIF